MSGTFLLPSFGQDLAASRAKTEAGNRCPGVFSQARRAGREPRAAPAEERRAPAGRQRAHVRDMHGGAGEEAGLSSATRSISINSTTEYMEKLRPPNPEFCEHFARSSMHLSIGKLFKHNFSHIVGWTEKP